MNTSITSMTGLLNDHSSPRFQFSPNFAAPNIHYATSGGSSSTDNTDPFPEPPSKHGFQQPTFQPIAYMQGSGTHGSMSTQHLQHCQSCQLLDAQASKLRAERDIIRSMYQNLLIETQSAPKAESVARPTPLTHPKVRFWKQSQFDTFVLSPEGAVAKLGPSPYLETEDGEPIGYESIKAIRQTLRGAWTELANQGKAPQTWGMLSASGSELFNLLMETAYPLFKLADDGWKLKRFATQAYPAWRAIHLDEDCRLLSKGKKAVKMEVDENAVSGQKRKGDKSLPKTSGKRFKGEENSPGPSLSTQPAPVVPNTLDGPDVGDRHVEISTPHLSVAPESESDDLYGSNEEISTASTLASPRENTEQHPELRSPSSEPPVDTPVSNSNNTSNAQSHSHSQWESETNKDGTTQKKFVNPLSMEALKAANFGIPQKLSRPLVDPANMDNTEDANEESHQVSEDMASGEADKTPAKASEGDTTIKKKRKYVWRPGTKKDGRTLCALRWLKQTHGAGGTGTAFKTYYDNVLGLRQRKEYHDEAQMLVSAGKWKTDADVCDGPVY